MKRINYQTWPARLGGYLLIPHELLHILGYRIAGKQCEYRWGNNYVRPIGSLTHRERLFGMLFPFGVFSTLIIVSGILSGFSYRQTLNDGSFIWFSFWTGLALIAGIYAGTTAVDLRKAYLLIFDKPWHSWTPLDFLFQPFVDWEKVRSEAGMISGEQEAKVM